MAIEDILRRIEEETRARIDAIISAAEKEAARVAESYRERAEKLREKFDAEIASRAAVEEKQAIVAAQLEMKKRQLELKREILAQVYMEARKRIEELPEKEFLEIVRSLVLENVRTGREEIVVPSSRKALFDESFLESLNKELKGSTLCFAAETGDFEWGVVLREGNRKVDLTMDTLFDQLAARIESHVAEVLFSERAS